MSTRPPGAGQACKPCYPRRVCRAARTRELRARARPVKPKKTKSEPAVMVRLPPSAAGDSQFRHSHDYSWHTGCGRAYWLPRIYHAGGGPVPGPRLLSPGRCVMRGLRDMMACSLARRPAKGSAIRLASRRVHELRAYQILGGVRGRQLSLRPVQTRISLHQGYGVALWPTI